VPLLQSVSTTHATSGIYPHPSLRTIQLTFSRPGQSLIVSDDLIASDADGEPPSSYTRDLINVCTLTTDLGAVPKSLFTRLTTTRGVEFDNLDFTLEMVVESAGLAFELKVDGFRYGRVEAEFH
jgi:hypothetical protein